MPSDESRVELALELQNVSKFFGDLAALKEVHLRFEPGDSVLIYGPHGAGKTTLLRTGDAAPAQRGPCFLQRQGPSRRSGSRKIPDWFCRARHLSLW